MTDRELFKMALDCLENAIDLQQSEIDTHILHYGEWYRPQRVEFMKEYLNKTNQSIEALRTRLAQPEPYPENFIDALRFDAAQYELTIDGWPLYSGLPQPEPEPVAWGVDEGEGRCISLHDLYFVKKDADHMAELKGAHAKVVALYTAQPKKEWVGFTQEEHQSAIWTDGSFGAGFLYAEKLLKEKNT